MLFPLQMIKLRMGIIAGAVVLFLFNGSLSFIEFFVKNPVSNLSEGVEKIIAQKHIEVAEKKSLVPAKMLEKSVFFDGQVVSMKKYVCDPEKSGIISEFKRKSPSKGQVEKLRFSLLFSSVKAPKTISLPVT